MHPPSYADLSEVVVSARDGAAALGQIARWRYHFRGVFRQFNLPVRPSVRLPDIHRITRIHSQFPCSVSSYFLCLRLSAVSRHRQTGADTKNEFRSVKADIHTMLADVTSGITLLTCRVTQVASLVTVTAYSAYSGAFRSQVYHSSPNFLLCFK